MKIKIDPPLGQIHEFKSQPQELNVNERKLEPKPEFKQESEKSKAKIMKKNVSNENEKTVKRLQWTELEDLNFLNALKTRNFGDWESIAGEIKTRNEEQVKNRAIGKARNRNTELVKLLNQKKKEFYKKKNTKPVTPANNNQNNETVRPFIDSNVALLDKNLLNGHNQNQNNKKIVSEKKIENKVDKEPRKIVEKYLRDYNKKTSTRLSTKFSARNQMSQLKEKEKENPKAESIVEENENMIDNKEIVNDETITSDEQKMEHKFLIADNNIENINTEASISDPITNNTENVINTPIFEQLIETEKIQNENEAMAKTLRAPEMIESETPIASKYPDENKELVDDTKTIIFDKIENNSVSKTIQEIALEPIAEAITENTSNNGGVFENMDEVNFKESESIILPTYSSEQSKSLELIIPNPAKVENDKVRIKTTTTTARSAKKSNSSTFTTTKRTYTRRKVPLKSSVNTNINEEVSIMDSSSGSDKSSINIMSSSESGELVPSVSSRLSRRSSLSSVKSTSSKVSKSSLKSSKSSTISDKSKNSNDSIASLSPQVPIQIKVTSPYDANSVQEWEKSACPAIFNNSALKNSEEKFIKLRKKIIGYFEKIQNSSLEDCVNYLRKYFSSISIEQTLRILIAEDILKPFNKSENIFSLSENNNSNIEKIPFVNGTELAKKWKYKKSQKKNESLGLSENDNSSLEEEEIKILKKLSSISSGRKRKIRSEEGDWIDPNELEGRVISHEDPKGTPIRTKRKIRITSQKEKDEAFNSTEDPFRLILLNDFLIEDKSENEDMDEAIRAPFKVEMCTSVILLMDLHAHLHSSEIIGLLGGTFIKKKKNYSIINNNNNNDDHDGVDVLKIDYGYPCATAHSTGTQVDVDPISEMEAGEYFESKSVHMTGWYHSHPNFEPNPSLRDLETQTMYQGLFKNSQPDSDIEPFVGVIVNPYMAITESSSHVECFYVVPNSDESQERLPYRLPIQKIPFNPQDFPELLQKMREIVIRAESSPDRLNMQKNAQPGQKRIGKLMSSLRIHGNLDDEQIEQIRQLFN